MERAADAYLAARREAEEHGAIGEAAMVQVHLAFACAFADRSRAEAELELAQRLLSRISTHSSETTARIADVVRDAGWEADLSERAAVLFAEIEHSGLAYAATKLQLALCFHHAVLDDRDGVAAGIVRLRELTQNDNYAYYVEIAHFMADLPLSGHTARARWTDGEQRTRQRWRGLVLLRRRRT
ncbi:hypothetical protein [Streptomyces sp. NPDC047315]|uniref:hypothetical protein n=1 Tax=Streptomyces sp. NPDC047315 TaxID=3155142 RepID=UPI00340F1174